MYVGEKETVGVKVMVGGTIVGVKVKVEVTTGVGVEV